MMNKIAVYELLLEDHPLWNKEAAFRTAKEYKKWKPLVSKIYAARVPRDAHAVMADPRTKELVSGKVPKDLAQRFGNSMSKSRPPRINKDHKMRLLEKDEGLSNFYEKHLR